MVAFILLTLIVSGVFCFTKYAENSHAFDIDLEKFSIADGFVSDVTDGTLRVYADETGEGVNEFCAESPFILLNKGSYSIGITYYSEGNNLAYIQAGDSVYEEILLPAGEQSVFHEFVLDQPVEDARIKIAYSGASEIVIKTVIIAASKPIVTDWIFVFIIITAIVLAFVILIKLYLCGKIEKKQLLEMAMVVIVAILSIPYLELVSEGIYWGTDTNVQNVRIEGIKDALIGGQFPAIIAPMMCNGHGSVMPIMYPSLFIYPFVFLRLLGVSPVMVYKIAHIVINIFICTACYFCVKKITASEKASSIALVAFAFSKYHLEMVGIRDWTYGMGISLIFVFIVIIGVYEIFEGNRKSWIYLTVGMWGVINSHILSAIFSAFIVAVMLIVYWKKTVSEGRLVYFVYAVLASVPACLYRIYTFLDVFIHNKLNTDVLNRHNYDSWLYSIEKYFTDPVSVLSVCIAIIAIFVGFIFKNELGEKRRFFLTIMGIDLACILAVSDMKIWHNLLKTRLFDLVFGYIQYPDRMFQIIVPFTAILIGIMVERIKIRIESRETEKVRISRALLGVIVAMICITSVWAYIAEITVMKDKEKAFSDRIIGDVISFPGMTDYIPDGENHDSYSSGKTPYYSNESITINSETYKKNGINISCDVINSEGDNYIDFPLFFYNGYVCEDNLGNEYKVGLGEKHRLRVYFEKSSEPIHVNIKFNIPIIYSILLVFSNLFMVVLIVVQTKIDYCHDN
ncbi:MAG: hypothetical protein Q4D29_02360 [Lachnospiraceae bacterium]|nr:hypothetical protein [Lachnospiraceae bacterium]